MSQPKGKQTSTPTLDQTPKIAHRAAQELKLAGAKPTAPVFTSDDENDLDAKWNKLSERQDSMSKLIENLIRKCDSQEKRLDEKDAQIRVLTHKVIELDQNADLVKLKLCDLENDSKLHNLRIDGKSESSEEDLKTFVCELATKIGCTVRDTDIESIFRIGRVQTGKRPRTIMVRFVTRESRNKLYFNRTKLNNQNGDHGNTNKLWINDDITSTTARQREELRSIADLCKVKGENDVKVHTDGIILRNKKIKMDNLTTLPKDLTLEKAKTVKRDEQVYYQSQHSVLSNMYPCHIVLDAKHYSSAEQAFQCLKANNANDSLTERRIWAERDVFEQKRIGDQIGQDVKWEDTKLEIMERILEAKFSQNPTLKTMLLETKNYKLNEATRDSFWGIGCTLNAPPAKNHTWRGSNRAGRILEKVRSKLQSV